jgi:hypothetical protein
VIDNGHPGAWADALLHTRPSLLILTTSQLHDPALIAKVQREHGLPTMRDALELVADEKKRRTMTNDFPKG